MARMRLISGACISAWDTCMLGLSIQLMMSGGAPAATAASRTMRAASTVHLAALWGEGGS